jgi:hypothetical protein
MNMPPELTREPTNDRRSVPRHIRDGEHDSLEDTMAGVPPGRAARLRPAMVLICVAVALAAGFGAWIALR